MKKEDSYQTKMPYHITSYNTYNIKKYQPSKLKYFEKQKLIHIIQGLSFQNKRQKALIGNLKYKLRNNNFRIEKIKRELDLLNI